jgi:sulfoquinovosidase
MSARSVSALVVVALLAGLSGVAVWSAPVVQRGQDAADLEPGLLQVAPKLRGAVSLGNAVYARFDGGGLVVSRLSKDIWRGVAGGATVTAGFGRLDWRGGAGSDDALRAHEVIDRQLGNLSITGRSLQDRRVVYTGRVFADDPDGPDSRPVTITITRRSPDSRVLLDVQVPGADLVVLHAYREAGFSYQGLGVQRAGVRLPAGHYPMPAGMSGPVGVGDGHGVSQAPVPMVVASTSTGFALDTAGYSAFDLRHDGRLDAVVWQPELRARVYDGTPGQIMAQHANDVGRARPLPTWSASGAVVGVRGSNGKVLAVVRRLQRADAALAAVLVRDGGARPRYPDWARLVDQLAATDVRVLTTADPVLAVRRRPGGPADEPELLAMARSRGWLVTDRSGRPVRVPATDPDVGQVPGELIDLSDPAAAAWYTQVLADRMRRERLSGWRMDGGDELPPNARTARGEAGSVGPLWPSRWAAVARAACQQAGRPDCLLLHGSADERTVLDGGVADTGPEVADWSTAGLGGALAAQTNAGLSGVPLAHSAVGGVADGRTWWGGRRVADDELLLRWTEMAVFGPVLRTEDGDHPDGRPQVWDSDRLATAFARLTRIYAALADYRRAVAAQATDEGLPMVRPAWLSDPDLPGPATDGQFRFGGSLIVVPVLAEGRTSVQAVLPPGRWVELLTGRVHTVRPPPKRPRLTEVVEPKRVTVQAPLGRPAVLFAIEDRDAVGLRSALRSAGLIR